tara:strand:+ start:551 stop:1222 length:672 start_codon:yes stop_codon:yes gene_type:complete
MNSLFKKIFCTLIYGLILNPILKILKFDKKIIKKKNNKNRNRWISGDQKNHSSFFDYISLPQEGPEVELIKSIKFYSKKNDKILDMGANCGRFSNELFTSGYKFLYAVDISGPSYEHLGKIFPDLKSNLNYSVSSFEDYFEKIPDNYFDITFTMGSTIDLVHPSYNIVKEISRITKKYSILQLQKKGPPYIRFWDFEFMLNGLKRESFKNTSFRNFDLKIYKK